MIHAQTISSSEEMSEVASENEGKDEDEVDRDEEHDGI